MKRIAWIGVLLAIIVLGYGILQNIKNTSDDVVASKKIVEKSGPNVVNVYSSRKEDLVENIFKSFTDRTNIKVNYVIDNASNLIARMISEGERTNADVFLTADVINLIVADKHGLLGKFNSTILNEAIPEIFRSEHWYGLTKRARVIVYAKDRVSLKDLSTYEDLASSKWKDKLVMRSSNSYYNQSLLSSVIAASGERKAREWVKGVVKNMARNPRGGDIDQIKSVAAGEADLTVANTYYLGRIMASDEKEDREISSKVAPFFPNQNNRGTMINISGAAITKFAKNKTNAIRLLEFMVGTNAQKMYAEQNQEYPIVESIKISAVLKSWGDFKVDKFPLKDIEQYLNLATRIADEEGWK